MTDFMYVAVTKKDWDEFAQLQGFARTVIRFGVSVLMYEPGYWVDEIGPIGDDGRHHVNVRIHGDLVPGYVAEGVPAVANVTWIDPATVATPHLVRVGGSVYYDPSSPTKSRKFGFIEGPEK